MRTAAGFHADLAAWCGDCTNGVNPFGTAQFLTPNRLLKPIYAVYLENALCQIDPNADNLHIGPLLVVD
jgi:hypothetical protein